MDETLLFPSPNWFMVTNIAVSKNGWIIYGGPSKSICVLEPFDREDGVISGNQTFRAHMAPRAHGERVVSVDISPEFPEKKNFLSGSYDGTVKQWTLERVSNKYKIRTTHSHDVHFNEKEEITGVGYSTESIAITVGGFGNIVKWNLTSNVCKSYLKFLANFKPTCMTCSPHIPLNVAVGTKQGVVFLLDLAGEGKIVYKIRGQDDEITNLSWCPQYELLVKKRLIVSEKRSTASARMEAIRNEPEENVLEQSGFTKNLPEDSFDESVVEEDDMFDIYKDHDANEFGHKKYEPEEILVKVTEEKSDKLDYLAECLKLKEDILKRKNEEEQSLESLVEAMDKTHVNTQSTVESSEPQPSVSETVNKERNTECSVHMHKHLLATIGRFGGIRIWSKTGKLVASCSVLFNSKATRSKATSWPSVLWYTPDTLLLVDGKSQLVECNPLQIDCKNKLECRVVHSLHNRGLFAITTDAPRVQKDYDSPESPYYHTSNNWSVYTSSQDRYFVRYSMKNRKKLAIHNTCGGFLYNVHFCPYDAGKMAISVGDGAVRVWQSSTLENDDTKLYPGKVQTFWQNVQGKVLTVAWHPTKENLLAFGTAESRVGLLDVSGKAEKPAKVLLPALNGGVYSLCWGEHMKLYASGGSQLVVYNANKQDDIPVEVDVVVEGQKWAIGAASWNPRGLLCGSHAGAIAVLDPTTHETRAIGFFFSKIIHTMEWHPLQTSNASEESPYKNLIAVCSLERTNNVVIVEYKDKEGGGKELSNWKTLSGHKMPVLQVTWSPHRDELLLSTSQDTTVRVWDVVAGTCISIFGNHSQHSLGATWCAMPQLETKVVSGGGDCCLRLWDYRQHTADAYEQVRHETSTKSKKSDKKENNQEQSKKSDTEQQQVATPIETVRRTSKKHVLPIMHKQTNSCRVVDIKHMIKKYVESNAITQKYEDEGDTDYKADFVNIFGTTNEVNQVLDKESENLLKADFVESWITLAILRGHIDSVMQFAAQRDMLCPYLLSMAPCVSFKYWKEVTQLYIAQIDRMVAKGYEERICSNRHYGGAIYKKATMLLSIHDVKGAVTVLTEAKLFKEAYVLCRIRYMDSIAEETLQQWAKHSYLSGNVRMAAVCYIALGNLAEAATVLSKFNDQETLSLAADLAKMSGRDTFANHMEKKALNNTSRSETESAKDLLEDLPSRIQLLMNDVQISKGKTENGDHENGDCDEEKQSGDKHNGDIKVENNA